MNDRSNAAAILAYLFSWIGWLIAMCIRDPGDAFTTQHLNQALILQIISTVGGFLTVIPVLGQIMAGIIGVVTLVMSILGIVRAATWSMEPLPFISNFRLI